MPAATHAFLCGLWDGLHLWVQWDDNAPDAGYRLQVRLRPVPLSTLNCPHADPPRTSLGLESQLSTFPEWEPWRDVSAKPLRRAWAVVPLWREGWSVQARVAAVEPETRTADGAGAEAGGSNPEPETPWSPATEVTFQQARCAFEIATETTRVHYLPGTEFSTKVDGAPCHWRLDDDVQLEPWEKVRLEMTAGATGYSQLDRADHFDLRPVPGLRIRNLEPSVDDVRETGRDFTVLASRPRDTPLKVTFRRKTPPA